MTEQEMTNEQAEQMIRELAQGKENLISFFRDIVKTKDTTKVGNLSIEELGEPQLELRGIKELELFSKDIYQDNGWENFFHDLAEIQTSTSLSREGFLIRQSNTSTKQMADTTVQERKRNSGWFKKKE